MILLILRQPQVTVLSTLHNRNVSSIKANGGTQLVLMMILYLQELKIHQVYNSNGDLTIGTDGIHSKVFFVNTSVVAWNRNNRWKDLTENVLIHQKLSVGLGNVDNHLH